MSKCVSENPLASSKDIDTHLCQKFINNTNLNIKQQQQLPTLSHRKPAIDFLLNMEVGKLRRRYHMLPQFLSTLIRRNGGFNHRNMISVALQGTKVPSDQPSHFYRMFVGFPIACFGQSVHVPVLFIDFYHYQCPYYDGKLASLCSKLGDGSTVVLANAIIPNENVNNIGWFLQLCALHGVNFDCALFADRGHIVTAAKQLTLQTNLRFNLMHCVQHLKRNAWHKFPLLKEAQVDASVQTGTLLEGVSKAKSTDTFFRKFYDFLSKVVSRGGAELTMNLARYLLSIDPMHWTVIANNGQLFSNETHLKHVNNLLHTLQVALKLEQHLLSLIHI